MDKPKMMIEVGAFEASINKIRLFVRLNLSARLISHGIIFFSHNKTAPAGLSAAEIIQQTG
jgi:hypothetical protein